MKNIVILLVLLLPTVSLLFRPGIYTMHDFHVFRTQQFDLCVKELVFPCRWAPDMTLGFGQPLFNYYGQFIYWLSAIPRLLGSSLLDAYKIVSGLSIIASAVTMYILGKHLWGPRGAIISSLLYVYAPYRAVDLWVRGAIPESMAFVFFPLILLFLYRFNFLGLAISTAGLIITHNLSTLMFAPFAAIWWLYFLVTKKNYRQIFPIIVSGIVAILLSAFYLLPVAIENPLVTVKSTTESYYQYAHHFVSLKQLFFSDYWGYGGSIWGPNDGMSFSVGLTHWVLLFITLLLFILKLLSSRSGSGPIGLLLFLTTLGLLAAFLTHGKSEIIWKLVPGLSYVQFPWRFLTMTTLFFSLAAGAVTALIPTRPYLLTLVILIVLTNFSVFKPDIWRQVTDSEHFSGPSWDEQKRASPTDFWPQYAPQPVDFAAPLPQLVESKAHSQKYSFEIPDSGLQVTFPTVYFPGWTGILDGQQVPVYPAEHSALIQSFIPAGVHTFELRFIDTWPRLLGNTASAITLLGLVSFSVLKRAHT